LAFPSLIPNEEEARLSLEISEIIRNPPGKKAAVRMSAKKARGERGVRI